MRSEDWSAMRATVAEQCTGRSPNGLVAAAAPLAAALGAECLRSGGNVFDAVTVAALAETVLLPPKCGFGGDLVALVLPAGETVPRALIAVGGAPQGLAEVARSGAMTVDGPTSVGVPAAAAGYAALSELGRFDRGRHAAPARALATGGFAWSKVCTFLAEQSSALLRRQNPSGTRYLPGGKPIAPGAVVRLPGLATVLSQWVERGAQFLSGPVGEAVVEAVRSRGGILEPEDLAYAEASWEPCVHGDVAGHDVWATPSPTHGVSLLDALKLLGDPLDWTPASVYRAVAEAVDRRQRAEGEVLVDGGTSIVSGADEEGNLAVVIHSNSFPRFGSGIVLDEYDLILANRAGRGFSSNPRSANFPAAGRRPSTTLHAWSLARRASPLQAVGGTPGGVNQVPWNAQLLADLMRAPSWPGEAVVNPRWEWLPETGGVRFERGTDPALVEELRQAAGRLEMIAPWGLRCAQQVVVRPTADGSLVACADPRTVGAVVPG